jgi:hypothetical protein
MTQALYVHMNNKRKKKGLIYQYDAGVAYSGVLGGERGRGQRVLVCIFLLNLFVNQLWILVLPSTMLDSSNSTLNYPFIYLFIYLLI